MSVNEAIVAVVAAATVWAFFRALESGWPTSYFTPDSATDPVVNRTLTRYTAWRLLPVFGAASTVAVTLVRMNESPGIGVALFGAAHFLMSVGHALLLAVLRRSVPRPGILILHGGVAIGVAAASWTALLIAPRIEDAIPEPGALLQALWLGGFAAVLGLYLSRVSEAQRSPKELVRLSRKELPEELFEHAHRVAVAHSADPRIVEAVMLVENLQRPGWVRSLERRKAVFAPAGTYGVMQVAADRELTDEESLDEAVRRFMAGAQIPGDDHDGLITRNTYKAARAIDPYNPSTDWQYLVRDVLSELTPDESFRRRLNAVAGSTELAPDRQPVIDLEEARFMDGDVMLAGSAWLAGDLLAVTMDASGAELSVDRPALSDAEERRRFRHRVRTPIGSLAVVLRPAERQPNTTIPPACRFTLPKEWRHAVQPAE